MIEDQLCVITVHVLLRRTGAIVGMENGHDFVWRTGFNGCDMVQNFVFLGNRLERTLHPKVLQFREPLVFLFINNGY